MGEYQDMLQGVVYVNRGDSIRLALKTNKGLATWICHELDDLEYNKCRFCVKDFVDCGYDDDDCIPHIQAYLDKEVKPSIKIRKFTAKISDIKEVGD